MNSWEDDREGKKKRKTKWPKIAEPPVSDNLIRDPKYAYDQYVFTVKPERKKRKGKE